MNYVLAAMAQLNGGNSAIVIKARGRAISKAVDVVLIIQDRFVQNSQLQDIVIKTELLNDGDGVSTRVSSVEITMWEPLEAVPSSSE